MLLIDKKLFKQGTSMIEPFDEEQVTNIGYDLRTDCFFLDTNTSKKEVDLAPGDTVFVSRMTWQQPCSCATAASGRG